MLAVVAEKDHGGLEHASALKAVRHAEVRQQILVQHHIAVGPHHTSMRLRLRGWAGRTREAMNGERNLSVSEMFMRRLASCKTVGLSASSAPCTTSLTVSSCERGSKESPWQDKRELGAHTASIARHSPCTAQHSSTRADT